MFSRFFTSIYSFVSRHFRSVQAVLVALILLSLFALPHIDMADNIETMLPARGDIIKSIRFLRESGLSDKVILSISSRDPEGGIEELLQQVDELGLMLKGELVTEVLSTVPEGNLFDDIAGFIRYVPQLTDSSKLEEIRSQLTKEKVEEKVAGIYTRLLSPGGSFMLPFFRADPLSLSGGLLEDIHELTASLGYRVNIEQGHLVSEDGSHALLVLETPVLITDGTGSKELMAHIERAAGHFTETLSVNVIAGHRHAVSNERVIRRDVARTCIIAALAFFLLFLLVCKDLRVGFVFLMPLIGIVLAINLTSLLMGTLSYFIAGLGAVIAGISIDYGIHVYIAKKQGGDDAVRFVAKPVIIGALTTLSVFFSFFFSSVPGYSELACFSILSILLCLVLSLFLLPHLVKEGELPLRGFSPASTGQDRLRLCIAAGWLVFLMLASFLISDLAVDTDVKNFDGSEQQIFDDEKEFHRVWGGEDQPAVLVVEGATLEEALFVNSGVSKDAISRIGRENFMTFSSIWKTREERKANLREWNSFWENGAEKKLRMYLSEAAAKYDFTNDVFEPFFEWLYTSPLIDGLPEDLEFLRSIRERFVIETDEKVMVLSYFADTPRNINNLSAVCEGRKGDCFIVSRKMLSLSISEAVESEIIRLSLIAGILIMCLLFILLRKLLLVLLALVPVITAIACMLGILPLLDMQLNAASIIAAMVVVGLCIDYGIFMIYHQQQPEKSGLKAAVGLSAATTFIGAGALLFASHPVMLSIGITLSSGIVAGYVSAVAVIPALHELGKTGK